jgi:CheY-like chemotaxis protein
MDGLEATTRIREREQGTGERLRIIAMTAHAMKGDRERFLALGMDAYLPKPVAPQALFDLIETVPARRPPSDGAMGASPPLDLDELRQRLGDDDELIADVIGLFLEDCPARVDAIAAAVKAGDAAQVRSVAHALKGSASALAAPGVVHAAHTLELLGDSNDMVAARTLFPGLVEEVGRLIAALQELQKRG